MDSSFSNPSSSQSTSAAARNTGNDKNKKHKGGVAATMKLSTDPQSVAARRRRHRISDRFKILQSLVPGGSKMDTVSMLEEAIQYVKFLKTQIWLHQAMINLVENASEDPTSYSQPSNCAVLPFYCQNADLCDNCLGEAGLSGCWVPDEEDGGGFDASSMQR